MADTAPIVVFDLDGTLVDSMRDLIPALNQTTSHEGLPPIEQDDVGHVVGQGAMRMIERAFLFHGRELQANGDRHMELLGLFLKTYEAQIANKTIFFDGVLDTLSQLTRKGWKIAVCTNKYERMARKLLDQMGELHRFDAVTGSDTFMFKKPDPRHILETIGLANGDAKRAVMVGDSINDIAAAQAANIPSIAVDFGYSEVPVAELNPDIVISHFNEFDDALNTLMVQV